MPQRSIQVNKVVSNSRAVLESVPLDQRSMEAKDLDLEHERLPIERALGIKWCVECNVFGFRVLVNERATDKAKNIVSCLLNL